MVNKAGGGGGKGTLVWCEAGDEKNDHSLVLEAEGLHTGPNEAWVGFSLDSAPYDLWTRVNCSTLYTIFLPCWGGSCGSPPTMGHDEIEMSRSYFTNVLLTQ